MSECDSHVTLEICFPSLHFQQSLQVCPSIRSQFPGQTRAVARYSGRLSPVIPSDVSDTHIQSIQIGHPTADFYMLQPLCITETNLTQFPIFPFHQTVTHPRSNLVRSCLTSIAFSSDRLHFTPQLPSILDSKQQTLLCYNCEVSRLFPPTPNGRDRKKCRVPFLARLYILDNSIIFPLLQCSVHILMYWFIAGCCFPFFSYGVVNSRTEPVLVAAGLS